MEHQETASNSQENVSHTPAPALENATQTTTPAPLQTVQPSSHTTNVNFSVTAPVKLDRSNYLIWKTQVLPAIRGNGLENLVDGSQAKPINTQCTLTQIT